MNLAFSFVRSPKFSYVTAFLVGVLLRGIPELLVSRYPIGYETITYYAPPMFRFGELSLVDVFAEFSRSGPLFYVLMWFVRVGTLAHPYLILKVAGPLLYGGLTIVFFLFLERGLKLSRKMAFVATLMLVSQVAPLRISWDRFRSVLGLIFLFATLTSLKSNHKGKWLLVAIFGVLTALSREYISFVLFVAVLGSAILGKRERVTSLVALAPALTIFTIFAVIVYPANFWWPVNYVSDGQYTLGSYLRVVQDVFSIFALCYLPFLPFVVKGWQRDKLLAPVVGWLLLSSFSVIVSPWIAVPGYQRWLMLLVFPFTIYAMKGFDGFHLFSEHRIKMLVAIVLIFMTSGVGYSTGAFSYVMLSNSWVPVNLVQSSIDFDQIDDVKKCLYWLDNHATSGSSILTEERFYGWTSIYLSRANDDVKIIDYGPNSLPTPALERALRDGFRWIYLIWYTDWSLDDFQIIYSQNSVSIFQYEF